MASIVAEVPSELLQVGDLLLFPRHLFSHEALLPRLLVCLEALLFLAGEIVVIVGIGIEEERVASRDSEEPGENAVAWL